MGMSVEEFRERIEALIARADDRRERQAMAYLESQFERHAAPARAWAIRDRHGCDRR